MKFFRLLITVLLLAATLPASAADSVSFTSPDGRIAFWTPSKPTTSTETLPGQAGTPQRRVSYTVEGGDYTLLAAVLDFREGLTTSSVGDTYLNTMLQSMRSGFGAQFKFDDANGNANLTLEPNHFKGRQLRGSIQGQQMIMRAYIGEHSIYMVQVGYTTGNAASTKIAEHFLNSLVVNGK